MQLEGSWYSTVAQCTWSRAKKLWNFNCFVYSAVNIWKHKAVLQDSVHRTATYNIALSIVCVGDDLGRTRLHQPRLLSPWPSRLSQAPMVGVHMWAVTCAMQASLLTFNSISNRNKLLSPQAYGHWHENLDQPNNDSKLIRLPSTQTYCSILSSP